MLPEKLLIVGCGDIGRRVARRAAAKGEQVVGLVRSETSRHLLTVNQISPVLGDLLDPAGLPSLPTRNARVLYLAPPPGGGISDPKIRHFLTAIHPGLEPSKIVYVSTSGVYGNCRGEIVDETTPARPETARGKRRLDAELALRQFGQERRVPTVILRVTGIYGPFRLPLNRLVEHHPVLNPDEAAFTNRIHADDLAQICLAALDRGRDGAIYNVSDGQHSTMTDYFNQLADALGLPRPPQVSLAEAREVMTPLMFSYVQESRRMDNRKMLAELGVTLQYPTLAEGLAASLAEMLAADPNLLTNLKKPA